MLVRPDGSVLSKQEVLRDLEAGGLKFTSIEIANVSVRIYGQTALLTGEGRPVTSSNGQHARAHVQLLAVYVAEGSNLRLAHCDGLGYSLGGMVVQQIAQDRPAIFRRMILVATAPRGGKDIMHLEKPSLAKYLGDPTLRGYAVLQKIFFAPTESSQAAGAAFVGRLSQRKDDREPPSGPDVATAQTAAFREWEQFTGERFAGLRNIHQPTLVVNGVHDEMIPVANSYWLSENMPNAMLITYPDSGHGALFQFHDSFTRQATAFLASDPLFSLNDNS